MEPTTAKLDTRKTDVYTAINDRIIEQLEKGTAPWRKPWTSSGQPQNLISKKFYRGINMLLLAMEGYEHNLFLSFKQVHDIGGKVKKGEKGHIVVYWSGIENKKDGKEQAKDTTEQKKKIFYAITLFSMLHNARYSRTAFAERAGNIRTTLVR